jgi:hypothetical protein
MTLVGGGELFTGNTALVTAALYEKRATVKGLLKVSVHTHNRLYTISMRLQRSTLHRYLTAAVKQCNITTFALHCGMQSYDAASSLSNDVLKQH